MTADHAGQTGGERDPHWIKDRFELDGDDSGEREVCGCGAGGDEPSSDHSSWCPLHREYGSPEDAIATINRATRTLLAAGYQSSDLEWHPPSRPVPVAGQAAPLSAALGEVTEGQAAREAAVEAVARLLARYEDVDAWASMEELTRSVFRRVATELLSLPEVAALSAAPGQVCDRYETEPDGEQNQPADFHNAAPGQEQGR